MLVGELSMDSMTLKFTITSPLKTLMEKFALQLRKSTGQANGHVIK